MNAVEFVMWMNGAAELVGDEPPTKEQWERMHAKLGEAVGEIVSSKLLEKVNEHQRMAEEKARAEEMLKQYYANYNYPSQKPMGVAQSSKFGLAGIKY